MKNLRSPLCVAVAMKMVRTATVILHDVWTMCWTPCDRRHPAASEGHFMDMHDGRQGAYLCVGLADSCGTLGLTQSTFGFGLTACEKAHCASKQYRASKQHGGEQAQDGRKQLWALALRLVLFSFRGAISCHGWNNQSRSMRMDNNMDLVV